MLFARLLVWDPVRVGEQNATWSAKNIIGQILPTYCTFWSVIR